jgi:hypothetical protein
LTNINIYVNIVTQGGLMHCTTCGNKLNFIVFKGEVTYFENGSVSFVEKNSKRFMCRECFSSDIIENSLVKEEAA